MWSKHKRDISVSKMEGHAFLFRVPCPNARRRILKQSIWQVNGQTMFVAKWTPGPLQEKPQLSMVPVWVDFTGVPLQFFNRDALKEIAGLVGHPIGLHPSTENLTNIEVARVYTVIDPRKPLPEAVNAQFETGEIRRITVSSPWLPSICSFCKKIGHTISRCSSAPKTCTTCNSVKHLTVNCPRTNPRKHVDANANARKNIDPTVRKQESINLNASKHEGETQGHREGKAPIRSLLPIVSKSQDGKVYRRKVQSSSLETTTPPTSNSFQLLDSVPETLSESPQKSFAEVSAQQVNNSITLGSGNQVAALALQPVTSAKKISTVTAQDSTLVFNYDLSKGGLCVDLSSHLSSPANVSSEDDSYSANVYVSSSENLSGEDDNSYDGNDNFIEVVSKRLRRHSKYQLGGRGPLTL